MSSLTMRRRVSPKDVQVVQNLIERCLQLYMNKKEVVDTLVEKAKIEPCFTEIVWQKLEEENRDFFREYHLRLMLKHQIMVYNKLLEQQAKHTMEYNKLLEQQANHMRQIHPTGETSVQNRNGSHVPSMNQQQLCFENKDSDQFSPYLSSPHFNVGSTINTNIPSYVESSTNIRRVDPPPNLLPSQATTMPSTRGMINQTAYSNFGPHMYGVEAHSTVGIASNSSMPLTQGRISTEHAYSNCDPSAYGVEAHFTVGDASISPFINDTCMQSLNDPLVDASAFFGPISPNFSISDLTAAFPEISGDYEKIGDYI